MEIDEKIFSLKNSEIMPTYHIENKNCVLLFVPRMKLTKIKMKGFFYYFKLTDILRIWIESRSQDSK